VRTRVQFGTSLLGGMLVLAIAAISVGADAASAPLCTADVLRSPDLFNCLPGPDGVPAPEPGPASTYANPAARAAFPDTWDQYGYDQRHDPVFPGNGYTTGVFWAAPLTGIDMLRAFEAQPTFTNPESRATRTGQSLGEVMGVSVANGIVYSQIGRREVNALDAITGKRIWRQEIVNIAGMGQGIVHDVQGVPMVFVPVGDASFNVYETVRYTNNEPHARGGSFGALYAFDGLSGELKWRFDVRGAARPVPIYRDGKLYLTTGGGQLFVLDAATGTQIGVTSNPGNGFAGLAAPNWYETSDGKRYIIYGITRPRLIIAMDVTNPANPTVAWQMVLPDATANSPGDTSVAVDPDLGLVITTAFSSVGGISHEIAHGIDATTGVLIWSQDLGAGDRPPGFKASVPMIKSGNVYVGNTINQTFWSLVAANGNVRWVTDLSAPGERNRLRAAAAFYTTPGGQDVVIHASASHIRTLDANSGVILNDYRTLGAFSVFGVAQPAIVGNQMYLASISGWIFAAPVDFIMSHAGVDQPASPGDLQAPPIEASFDPSAQPSQDVVSSAAKEFSFYAGGQDNNAFSNQGGKARVWQTPLRDALPLDSPPVDEAIYGPEVASQLTHWEYGVGSGVAVAQGMVYAGSNRYGISALNAENGRVVWTFNTLNRNFGQPIVTPNTVIVGGGDTTFNLGTTGDYKDQSTATQVGALLQHVTGLDPKTGKEKWTVWTGSGSNSHTPLFYNGNVYWVSGEGRIYAVNADTGVPVMPFMDGSGNPSITLDGFNAISSPNLFLAGAQAGDQSSNKEPRALMVVGLGMPARMIAIDLATAQTVWTQELAGFNVFLNGFSATSVAVDQTRGTVVGSVLTDVDLNAKTATLLAFGLDAMTGSVRWTQAIGTGAYPEGFVAATPVVSRRGAVFFNCPLNAQVVSIETTTGAIRWQTAITFPPGRFSWGPAVVVNNDARQLIAPIGPDLYAFDADTGVILNQKHIGGSLTYNNPVVAGNTLYIGNSWGWVSAMPTKSVTGK